MDRLAGGSGAGARDSASIRCANLAGRRAYPGKATGRKGSGCVQREDIITHSRHGRHKRALDKQSRTAAGYLNLRIRKNGCMETANSTGIRTDRGQ